VLLALGIGFAVLFVRKEAAHDKRAPRMLTPRITNAASTIRPRSVNPHSPDSFYASSRGPSTLSSPIRSSPRCTHPHGPSAIPPSLLACATSLQFHRNLSDRRWSELQLRHRRLKVRLGLRLDERPFDHSSLGDFRQRLLTNGKEKAVFNQILQRLVATGLITRNEIQRIDATHVLADIAIPTTITLITKVSAQS